MMRRSAHFAVALLTVTVLLCPVAMAQEPILPRVLDEHIGDVFERFEQANSTYGEREEFQRGQVSLAEASLSMLNGGTLAAEDALIKSVGGLETGKARAQAGGQETGEDVVDHARVLAGQAEAEVRQVRGNLQDMERTGLEPIAFSGGLTAAHAANRATDMLEEYEKTLEHWETHGHDRDVEASLVSMAAGAQLMSSIAADTLSEVSERRVNATPVAVLDVEQLDELVEHRVGWSQANQAAVGHHTRERLMSYYDTNERLMTLSMFTIHFQNMAFNGLTHEYERGERDDDPHELAWELHNESRAPVEAWVDTLEIPGDIPIGALDSARFTLTANANVTGQNYRTVGTYAVGLVHLAVEHTGLLQQAYGGEKFSPGTDLADPSLKNADEDGGLLAIPAAPLGATLAASLLAANLRRRETR